MDFVTITDHDTIDGCLEIADRPDVFVSEELTVWFRGEPQAVHVLCYGITPDDHDWLQAQRRRGGLRQYLHEREIACALAHPFYAVEAPLTPRHRRRLAQLFPVWETRNGSRARELNMPAAVYIETHGGTGIGGSDDHAGVDIGRHLHRDAARSHAGRVSAPTYARAGRRPAARQGQRREVGARGDGARACAALEATATAIAAPADPLAVFRMAERVMARAISCGAAARATSAPTTRARC